MVVLSKERLSPRRVGRVKVGAGGRDNMCAEAGLEAQFKHYIYGSDTKSYKELY